MRGGKDRFLLVCWRNVMENVDHNNDFEFLGWDVSEIRDTAKIEDIVGKPCLCGLRCGNSVA